MELFLDRLEAAARRLRFFDSYGPATQIFLIDNYYNVDIDMSRHKMKGSIFQPFLVYYILFFRPQLYNIDMEPTSALLAANLVMTISTLITHLFTLYRSKHVKSECCGVASVEYESHHEGNIGPPKIDENTDIVTKINENI